MVIVEFEAVYPVPTVNPDVLVEEDTNPCLVVSYDVTFAKEQTAPNTAFGKFIAHPADDVRIFGEDAGPIVSVRH